MWRGVKKFQNICLINFLANQAILSTFRFFSSKKVGGGGGKKFQNIFLFNFLAKSGNSKHFSFFHFFNKKIICSHYFCLPSTKIVVTMFACYLHNSSGMCLHLSRTNNQSGPLVLLSIEMMG